MALLVAFGMGSLSACASGEDVESVAGTQWNGTDSDGYRYEFHFDRGGGLVAYDPDYDEWTYSDDEYVLSWSQNGSRVTVTNVFVEEDQEFVASGSIEGDKLVLVSEEDPSSLLDLARVAPMDSDISGSEWAGTLLAPDDSLDDRSVRYFFDPDGSFRYVVSMPDRDSWHLSKADYPFTWEVSNGVVTMRFEDTDFDFVYSHVGTIDGDEMTIESEGEPANTIAILTRVE